ncbi:MAG: class I SAM-dependent methyltransferase [Phycisphaerae bacterium]
MWQIDLRQAADAFAPGSFSNRFRDRRFIRFERIIDNVSRPVSILDIGGTATFWQHRGWADHADYRITTLNIAAEESPAANITCTTGDATDLSQYDDASFDVVFSNSVIEHLFTFDAQKAMASEVRRYWVQTPYFWFPMEPHFHVVGWQWLPMSVRVAMIRRRQCGHRGPCPEPTAARKLVEEVRLVTRREMRRLFPDAAIWNERFAGLTKSLVAWRPFAPAQDS